MSERHTYRTGALTTTIDVTGGVDIEREVELSRQHVAALQARGVTEMRMVYRTGRWGRLALQKEVGPPPWRWPQIHVDGRRRRPWVIRVGAGWRSTLYTATYMAKPRHRTAE